MAGANSQSVGSHAESRALQYLEARGLHVVARNFRCRTGELDLVMHDGACLVFIEVRYRTPGRYASAAESIDQRKQNKLAAAASWFVANHPRFENATMRFDVVTLEALPQDEIRIQWLRDAFRPGE